MTDVRSLLRQQRAARRIEHPHAAYSDGGKLLCTVCHEAIKAEALWEGHVRSTTHRQRVQQAVKAKQAVPGNNAEAGNSGAAGGRVPSGQHKRKIDDDENMEDQTDEEAARAKRSRPEGLAGFVDGPGLSREASGSATPDRQGHGQQRGATSSATSGSISTPDRQQGTPPQLPRWASGTPVQGVELQIPSRPATPTAAAGLSSSGSAGTTPRSQPLGRSPLIPQEATVAGTAAGTGLGITSNPATSGAAAPPALPTSQPAAPPTGSIDEDEWAAFEAEMVHGASTKSVISAPQGSATTLSADAVISAPSVTAEELAARSEEEDRARRKALADAQLEDEKEEATRALETEFEEMEQLEARVSKLKERREALRRQGGSQAVAAEASAKEGVAAAPGKENADVNGVGGEEEDEDEDDDEEDDWYAFRFRA